MVPARVRSNYYFKIAGPSMAKKKETAYQKKIKSVMGEFGKGSLHSGKGGPVVNSRKQAIAIAISSAKRIKKKK